MQIDWEGKCDGNNPYVDFSKWADWLLGELLIYGTKAAVARAHKINRYSFNNVARKVQWISARTWKANEREPFDGVPDVRSYIDKSISELRAKLDNEAVRAFPKLAESMTGREIREKVGWGDNMSWKELCEKWRVE